MSRRSIIGSDCWRSFHKRKLKALITMLEESKGFDFEQDIVSLVSKEARDSLGDDWEFWLEEYEREEDHQ
ncbi:hypothetical protein [Salinithrix halophila]|uniref:Uncharacterized protein n=1 Tax=Salinithrix halophila TaxID=1485204 RepID=A0ABV8JHE3_9BACL